MTSAVFAAIPLRTVVDDPGLALEVVADSLRPGVLDQPVRWAHVSELRDPAPYLVGGELLLTAGVNLPEPADDVESYVRGLLDAGITALGFGVTPPMHEAVPGTLRAACVRHGLPLLVVPPSTPFLAISRAVTVALTEAAQRDQRRVAVAREALIKAAVEGLRPLVRVLAQQLDGWAALVGQRDEPVVEHRSPAPWPPAEVPELLARLRAGRGLRSATTELPDGTSVLAQPVSPQATASHQLVVGRRRRFDPTERAIVAVGAGLLGLVGRTGAAQLSAATTALLLRDAPDQEVLDGLLPGDDYRVVVGAPLRRRPKDGAAGHDWLSTRLETPLVRLGRDGGFTAITDSAPSPEVLAEMRDQGWLAVVSRPHPADALPQAVREAEHLLLRARALGSPPPVENAGLGLSTVVPAAAAGEFAARALGPLHRLDPDRRPGGLLDVLRVWLAHHGSWERTATALGVHRNSVRHRIGQAERALGVDLADPETRMELWFALRWDTQEPGGSA